MELEERHCHAAEGPRHVGRCAAHRTLRGIGCCAAVAALAMMLGGCAMRSVRWHPDENLSIAPLPAPHEDPTWPDGILLGGAVEPTVGDEVALSMQAPGDVPFRVCARPLDGPGPTRSTSGAELLESRPNALRLRAAPESLLVDCSMSGEQLPISGRQDRACGATRC